MKKLVRKSALRIRIAIGAPTSTKQRQLKPFAHRLHGSISIRPSRDRSCLSVCWMGSTAAGTAPSMRPARSACAQRPAASCSKRSMRPACSRRACGKAAMAISEGLVDATPLRLTASSGTSRTIVSGNEAFTSPMWSVPSRSVTTSVPAAASAASSASAADTVAGAPPGPLAKESVGRMRRRPSTAFTLIDTCAVLYDRCCRSLP